MRGVYRSISGFHAPAHAHSVPIHQVPTLLFLAAGQKERRLCDRNRSQFPWAIDDVLFIYKHPSEHDEALNLLTSAPSFLELRGCYKQAQRILRVILLLHKREIDSYQVKLNGKIYQWQESLRYGAVSESLYLPGHHSTRNSSFCHRRRGLGELCLFGAESRASLPGGQGQDIQAVLEG